MQDKDLGFSELKKKLIEFKRSTIKVGIQVDAGLNKENGSRIVDYAYSNEFGLGVPERSYIRSTADKKNNWEKEIQRAYTSVIDTSETAGAAIAKVGIIARDDIRQTITDGVAPENAPATVRKKKSSHTLIDTGALRNSIHYKFAEYRDK